MPDGRSLRPGEAVGWPGHDEIATFGSVPPQNDDMTTAVYSVFDLEMFTKYITPSYEGVFSTYFNPLSDRPACI